MKITKIGHCCLLVEVDRKRILTDPGSFTADDHVLENIDLVLITHEHGDHLHVESLQGLAEKNPGLQVVTNSGVGALLDEAEIPYTKLEGTDTAEIAGLAFEAFDAPHAEVFEDMADCHNTGYFITERFFYPGDAYAKPTRAVEVLALPVAGPWCKLGDVVRYVHELAPEKAFPVHDGLLNEAGTAIHHRILTNALADFQTDFVDLTDGESAEF